MPEELKTTEEGICLDLKFIALHPFGKFMSHVIKKYMHLKQYDLCLFVLAVIFLL